MRWNAQFDGTTDSLKNKSHVNKIRPYSAELRLNSVLLYRSGEYTMPQLAYKYGFSVNSIFRWSKRFDGTKESLMDKYIDG